jgi:serine/threonine-protein kinase
VAANDYLLDRVTAAVGDQYLIEGEIGRGGMAVVYRATDLRLHRTVAIKVLPPDVAFNSDVKTRFIREAQTAAQLNHPNIVPIYAVDEKDGASLVYFVMAFVEGESLGARLTREGAWSIERTVRVLRDVADALAYAHARGVVHRDIKPDNILIDRPSGRPMVTDFGIARATAGETRLTVTGVAVGTPAYMSPEQAMGEREVDGRSGRGGPVKRRIRVACGVGPRNAASPDASS